MTGDDVRRQVSAFLQRGVTLHGAGQLVEACRAYETVLALQPGQADALHLLGVIADQQGDHQRAIELIGQAIDSSPREAAFHGNLGTALLALGRENDAETAYRHAIALDPGYAEGLTNLGNLMRRRGDDAGAIGFYEQALSRDPQNPAARLALGGALLGLKRSTEALPHLLAAAEADRASAAARDLLATALRQEKRYDEALRQHRKAMALAPQTLRYREGYATTLAKIEDPKALADAAAAFEDILSVEPDRPDALIGIGSVRIRMQQPELAIAPLRRAFELDATRLEVLVNYSAALALTGRFDEALALGSRAVELFPGDFFVITHRGSLKEQAGDVRGALQDYQAAMAATQNRTGAAASEAGFRQALLLLSLGRLQEGWPLYPARHALRSADPRAKVFSDMLPAWDGTVHTGQRILAWGEQGVGDQVLYGSMIGDLLKTGAKAVLACDPRLVPLFRRSCPDLTVEPIIDGRIAELGKLADVQIGLADLGRWLRPDLSAFPAPQPFLLPDPKSVAEFRQRYKAFGKRRIVGLTWQSRNRTSGEYKSVSLSAMAPLLLQDDTLFVDMQYGDTSADRRHIRETLGVDILHDDSVDAMADLDRYAAQAAALDLMVGSSNSGIHLAAATGQKCWVIVPGGLARLWYWFLDRTDSPWYPQVRLFRQPPGRSGDWQQVMAEVAAAFAAETRSDTP